MHRLFHFPHDGFLFLFNANTLFYFFSHKWTQRRPEMSQLCEIDPEGWTKVNLRPSGITGYD